MYSIMKLMHWKIIFSHNKKRKKKKKLKKNLKILLWVFLLVKRVLKRNIRKYKRYCKRKTILLIVLIKKFRNWISKYLIVRNNWINRRKLDFERVIRSHQNDNIVVICLLVVKKIKNLIILRLKVVFMIIQNLWGVVKYLCLKIVHINSVENSFFQ